MGSAEEYYVEAQTVANVTVLEFSYMCRTGYIKYRRPNSLNLKL